MSIRQVLGRANRATAGHAGLVLDRYLSVAVGQDGHVEARKQLFAEARTAAASTKTAFYEAAFKAREQWVRTVPSARKASVLSFVGRMPTGRVAVGLGRKGPTETGICLHHTYGVPIIPGSALKGLVVHFDREEYDNVAKPLLGTTDSAGHVTFHDAWMLYQSVPATDAGLMNDIMTPHHPEYSAGARQLQPPTDYDDPKPVSFMSARGTFHFVLTCDDPSEKGAQALNLIGRILKAALKARGIGGKTSSGYGRFATFEDV